MVTISGSDLFYAAMGILPAIFWLTLFLREDRKQPEPKWMISFTFIFGAIGALIALALQLLINFYTPLHIDPPSAASLLVFAFIEEFSKFACVYFFVHKKRFFNEPVDGMIYMITGAMGFAALENIFYIFSYSNGDLFGLTIYRFIGAILLHALASGLIGYYWLRRRLVFGIVVATLLHWVFNLTVLYSAAGLIVGPAILGVVSFFIFRDFAIMKGYDKR